jgi:type IV pilus assembly protein PilN
MIRINLLPVKKKKKHKNAVIQMVAMGVVVLVTLGANWIWVMYYESQVEAQQTKISENTAEIERLKKIIGEVNELEKQKGLLRDQLAVIDKLERGKRGPVHVLDELSTHIPKRVWVTQFVERGGRLDLSGVGLDNSDISEFLRALQKSKYFTNVQLGFTLSTVKNGVSIYQFQITCQVNYAA